MSEQPTPMNESTAGRAAVPLERLAHCPDCGYSLEGLPHGHRCPECGFLPEPGLIVLWGWSGPRSGEGLTRPAPRGQALFGWALFLAWLGSYAYSGHWTAVLAVALLIGVPWLYYTLRLRSGYTRPARPVQLRLSARGAAQRIGYGPADMLPWGGGEGQAVVELTPVGAAGLQIRGYVESALGIKTARLCDFETELDAEDAAALRERLTAWVGAAGGRVGRVV
jgi:hypothetical protein